MPDKVTYCLSQINFTVGDLEKNRLQILSSITEAKNHATDVIIFPELAITGYPPEDLLLRPGFIRRCGQILDEIVAHTENITVIVGLPYAENNKLFNAGAVLQDKQTLCVIKKQVLPNYGVFDEKRYFTAGSETSVIELHGIRTAITICEDLWESGPTEQARATDAELLININASPFHTDKMALRQKLVSERATANQLPIMYLNLVGGQDELVFDGGSMIANTDGEIIYQADEFNESLYYVDLVKEPAPHFIPEKATSGLLPELDKTWSALVLGIRDYVGKNGFNGVVVGLSGGIDSALTLCLAVDALGADQVQAVLMPSPYTAQMSIDDAVKQSETLGVQYQIIPIETLYQSFQQALAPIFTGLESDTTEENLQARCRGTLLMAISNKQGRLVLATGNKSEMSVGYATLYGDMAGGFAPLKDVSKTLVYALSNWRNEEQTVIPERVINRPPSAELKPDQIDEDSLPPYSILDRILELYIEQDKSPKVIIESGFDHDTVMQVVRMVDRNEYKRRQAAPGVRISQRAFGRDRRYPITSGYREQ